MTDSADCSEQPPPYGGFGSDLESVEPTNEEQEWLGYSLSHDLNSPLTTAGMAAALLQRSIGETLKPEDKDLLETVTGCIERMKTLTDGMLHLARLRGGELKHAHVDLTALSQQIIEDLSHAEPQRKVQVVIAPGMTAWGDSSLLQIALSNLLRNAWKFTGRTANPRIEVGRAPEAEGTFFVRDNGAGFDMATAEGLFAPFHRLHHQDDFAGTGIGLASVRRIAMRHGGRVWAHATRGRGATFYLLLPKEPAIDRSSLGQGD